MCKEAQQPIFLNDLNCHRTENTERITRFRNENG